MPASQTYCLSTRAEHSLDSERVDERKGNLPSVHSNQALRALFTLHLMIADLVMTFRESTGSSVNDGFNCSAMSRSIGSRTKADTMNTGRNMENLCELQEFGWKITESRSSCIARQSCKRRCQQRNHRKTRDEVASINAAEKLTLVLLLLPSTLPSALTLPACHCSLRQERTDRPADPTPVCQCVRDDDAGISDGDGDDPSEDEDEEDEEEDGRRGQSL